MKVVERSIYEREMRRRSCCIDRRNVINEMIRNAGRGCVRSLTQRREGTEKNKEVGMKGSLVCSSDGAGITTRVVDFGEHSSSLISDHQKL